MKTMYELVKGDKIISIISAYSEMEDGIEDGKEYVFSKYASSNKTHINLKNAANYNWPIDCFKVKPVEESIILIPTNRLDNII